VVNGQLLSSGLKIISLLEGLIIKGNMSQYFMAGERKMIIIGVATEINLMFGILTSQIRASFTQQ
jgi:hypothetical protein